MNHLVTADNDLQRKSKISAAGAFNLAPVEESDRPISSQEDFALSARSHERHNLPGSMMDMHRN